MSAGSRSAPPPGQTQPAADTRFASACQTSALIAMIRPDGDIDWMTDGLRTLVGDLEAGLTGHTDLFSLLGFGTWPEALANLSRQPGSVTAQSWLPNQTGSGHSLHSTLSPVGGPEDGSGYLLQASDISQIMSRRNALEREAHQDPLTGLFNRRYLDICMQTLVSSAARPFAVILADLTGFKTINDTQGHATGDAILQEVAWALTEAAPLGETIARLGGDEFIVLIEDEHSLEQIDEIVEDLRRAINRPLPVGRLTLQTSASFGVARFPQNGTTVTDLLTHADTAMYADKSGRRAPGGRRRNPALPQFCLEMRDRLTPDQLEPYFQPIIDLDNHHCVGAEALCRWNHPERGLLEPNDFIPLAQSHDLVVDIDLMMFDAICAQVAKWRDQGFAPIEFSFNLSAATLGKRNTLERLEQSLNRHALSASQFCAELTESMGLMEFDPGRECVFDLQDLGMSVALDDFGTGFSSLALLKSLPISRLKIDISFIREILDCDRDRSIVEAIMLLSESLTTSVVAEGIERREQAELLTRMGAGFGQGFYFGRPVPASQFARDWALAA